jgi:hypothetical protein
VAWRRYKPTWFRPVLRLCTRSGACDPERIAKSHQFAANFEAFAGATFTL